MLALQKRIWTNVARNDSKEKKKKFKHEVSDWLTLEQSFAYGPRQCKHVHQICTACMYLQALESHISSVNTGPRYRRKLAGVFSQLNVQIGQLVLFFFKGCSRHESLANRSRAEFRIIVWVKGPGPKNRDCNFRSQASVICFFKKGEKKSYVSHGSLVKVKLEE